MFSTGSSGRKFRPGAITADQMFAGALVLIICSALALTAYFTCTPPGGNKGTGVPQGIWFKCDRCGEELSLDMEAMTMGERMEIQHVREGMQPHAIDCIKCGAKQKAFEMLTCPNPECKKRYVPAVFRSPMKQVNNPEKYKDICPFCKMELKDARAKARAEANK